MIPGGAALSGLSHGPVNPTAASKNWAGYAVQSNHIGAYRSVSAAWTEPRVNCSGVIGRRMASFWVGLDGANSPSVEQLGTDADCSGRVPVYFAWWEMFPNPSVSLPNRVAPGDHLFASVTFRGTQTYVLFIRDSSRGWSRTITKNQPGLARSSAEIIAESPALGIGGRLVIQPLSDFGTVRWLGSRVNGTLLRAIGRRINITMVEVNPPHRIRCVTSPVGAADVFTNTWIRSS